MKKWSSTTFSLTERALVGATLALAAANACTVSASRLLIDTQYSTLFVLLWTATTLSFLLYTRQAINFLFYRLSSFRPI